MAATVLGPYSTVAVSGTVQQLVAATPGHYNMTIYNPGPEIVYISNANTVGANATSYTIPSGATTPVITVWGPTGVWVAASAAGSISVLMQPRGA